MLNSISLNKEMVETKTLLDALINKEIAQNPIVNAEFER